MKENPCVLFVDDDNRLRELVARFLEDHGFLVQTARHADEARTYLAQRTFDVLVVDHMMPGETGADFIRSTPSAQACPSLMLTALSDLKNKIHAFESGADDFLAKPFEPSELLWRLKSLLRRQTKEEKSAPNVYSFGTYHFLLAENLLFKDNEPVALTSTEALLLSVMAQAPHHPFSRNVLAQRLGHVVDVRSVDVLIGRLRRKLEENPRHPIYIRTIRHIGYALCPD